MSTSNMVIFCAYKGPYPQGKAMANRLENYAKALSERNVSFIVASEGQKQTNSEIIKVFDGHEVWLWRKSYITDRIPILNSFFSVFIRFILYVFLIRKSSSYDVLYSAGYRWPQMLVFLLIARITGKKYIVELNEVPHSIKSGRFQPKWLNRIKKWITLRLVFPLVDGFIVISENLGKLASQCGKKSVKIVKIPILTDSITINGGFRNQEPFTIFHAGTLTEEKDGIVTVFEGVAKAMSKSDFNIRFILSNYQALPEIKRHIESIISQYGIKDKVLFHSYLNKEELDRSYNEANLVIINKPDNYRNRYNFSTKLGECMSYELPIICTAVGEAVNYLQDQYNCLILRSSEDADELASKILQVAEDPQLVKNLGEGAKQTAVKYFHYSNYSGVLTDFYSDL